MSTKSGNLQIQILSNNSTYTKTIVRFGGFCQTEEKEKNSPAAGSSLGVSAQTGYAGACKDDEEVEGECRCAGRALSYDLIVSSPVVHGTQRESGIDAGWVSRAAASVRRPSHLFS